MAAENAPPDLAFEAELVPFLPLLYVAWADGELEPEELEDLRSRCRAAFAGERCLALVERWLDPERPPHAADLAGLLAQLRRQAEPLPRAERLSLTALSRELATLSGRDIAPGEERALAEIEEALGLTGRPLLARIFPGRGRAVAGPSLAPGFEVDALADHLDGDIADVRRRVQALLLAPDFAVDGSLGREEYRQRVLGWCRRLAAEGVSALGLAKELGGADDPAAFLAAFEVLAYHDLSPTRSSSRSPRRAAPETPGANRTSSPPNSPLFTFISLPSPLPSHRRVPSTRMRQRVERKSSVPRRSAPPATCRLSSPSRETTFTRRARLESTPSKPIGHPRACIAPRRWPGSGATRSAASTTMAGLRVCGRSSTTMTAFSS